MDALKKLFGDLKFQEVTTYVQSGNVIFTSELTDPEKIDSLLTTEIKKKFGLDVPVITLTAKSLKRIIDNNPFAKDKEETFLHCTFLANKLTGFKAETIEDKKSENEEIAFSENVVYLYCPNGYGKTKLTNTFLENKLKMTATTRNWKTTNELLKIANQVKL